MLWSFIKKLYMFIIKMPESNTLALKMLIKQVEQQIRLAGASHAGYYLYHPKILQYGVVKNGSVQKIQEHVACVKWHVVINMLFFPLLLFVSIKILNLFRS